MKVKFFPWLLILSIPSSGLAWISGDESIPGPLRADIPHAVTELNNEHGLLWQQSMEFAGLPQALIGEFDLVYWTDANGFPAPLGSAPVRTIRPYALDGMSALPDHSFSLWDWAAGNLTCPIGAPGGSAVACHRSAGHMGPVGARHFPPQTRLTYAHYHALAMDRARQCATLADALLDPGSDIDDGLDADQFIEECEREALLLEAFGQHFLQDAWAIGHMWERWGSADLRDYEERDIAEAVALGAALIHGAESVLDEPDDLSSSVSGQVAFTYSGGVSAGAGDLHLSELDSNASYDAQRTGLYRCAVAGIRAVYGASRMRSGVMDGYSGPGTPATESELLGDGCFGQRATDDAMLEAIGLSGNSIVRGVQLAGASNLVRSTGVERDDLSDDFRLELLRLLSISWLSEVQGPNGLPVEDLAGGRNAFSSFMGVASNAGFEVLAPYVDPEASTDWPLPAGEGDAAQGNDVDARPSRVLARVFNRAHITGWCDDVEASPSVLRDGFQANPTAAMLALCEEFTARHVQPVGGQSLCQAVGLGSFTVAAEAGQSVAQAAGLYCDPPPPLEITAELDEPNPWVARVSVNLPGPGGSDAETDPSLPISISVDEDDDDHALEAQIDSDAQISISGSEATLSGTVTATLSIDQQQLSSGGEATGAIEWSVSFTVSTTADYRLEVEISSSYDDPLIGGTCTGSIGVLLTDTQPGDLQEFYADGCGDNYPQNLSQAIEGTLEAGTYLLTVTSDTPLASGWQLDGGFGDSELQIDSTFDLQIVEEGEDF